MGDNHNRNGQFPVDVLIPTFERTAALAITLAGLASQDWREFRVAISDQSDGFNAARSGEVQAMVRILQSQGRDVELHHHLPRRGLAEQRNFLLEQSRAPRALFLDDDVYLEPTALRRLMQALDRERCGFVGSAVIGLSFDGDERPHEQAIEFWESPVAPEFVGPENHAWMRHKLHNAANVYHVQRQIGLADHDRIYKVAWVGGCVLYDTHCLRSVGGFDFWRSLPAEHSGEDVVAQLRVMERYGGCGMLPSGAYHLELPTTVPNRQVDAPRVMR